jgi:hypothetical protein
MCTCFLVYLPECRGWPCFLLRNYIPRINKHKMKKSFKNIVWIFFIFSTPARVIFGLGDSFFSVVEEAVVVVCRWLGWRVGLGYREGEKSTLWDRKKGARQKHPRTNPWFPSQHITFSQPYHAFQLFAEGWIYCVFWSLSSLEVCGGSENSTQNSSTGKFTALNSFFCLWTFGFTNELKVW